MGRNGFLPSSTHRQRAGLLARRPVRAAKPSTTAACGLHPDAGCIDCSDHAGSVRDLVSGQWRGALRSGQSRLAGLLQSVGQQDQDPGSLSGGGQRASGAGDRDGDAVGQSGGGADPGRQVPDGPDFLWDVPPGGYIWWYLDAISDDGQHGLTIIAFVGSVFSPYYAWAGRNDPMNHCAFNVALYGPRRNLWAMTERGRSAVERSASQFTVGPSSMRWDGDSLVVDIEEHGFPTLAPIKGQVRLRPTSINTRRFSLTPNERHHWRPIAPTAQVEITFDKPGVLWSGHGYFDTNAGTESLEDGFVYWNWSRATLSDGGAAILYDADRRDGSTGSLALRFDAQGRVEMPPPRASREHALAGAAGQPGGYDQRCFRAQDAGGHAVLQPLHPGYALVRRRNRSRSRELGLGSVPDTVGQAVATVPDASDFLNRERPPGAPYSRRWRSQPSLGPESLLPHAPCVRAPV